LNDTNDTHLWVESPAVKIPDYTVVAVALNGQQFTRDIILHSRDTENTFEYYTDPLIISFSPQSGPSVGGTRVRINGLGFMPRRDKDGKIDRKKNKMFIRFVDPDSY